MTHLCITGNLLTKDVYIILLILNLNQEQGVISDRLVVRNVEQVCCYSNQRASLSLKLIQTLKNMDSPPFTAMDCYDTSVSYISFS
jgi:hypothetical protein